MNLTLEQEIASHEQDVRDLTVLIDEQAELLHEMYGESALATVEDIVEDPELVELYEARKKKLERLERLKKSLPKA